MSVSATICSGVTGVVAGRAVQTHAEHDPCTGVFRGFGPASGRVSGHEISDHRKDNRCQGNGPRSESDPVEKFAHPGTMTIEFGASKMTEWTATNIHLVGVVGFDASHATKHEPSRNGDEQSKWRDLQEQVHLIVPSDTKNVFPGMKNQEGAPEC